MSSVLPSLRLVRSRSFFIVAAVVVLLLVAAGGVYAYDSGRDDTIAKGVSIGGVPFGGVKAPGAKERLRAAVLEPLSRPVVARYHGHHFTLTPRQARPACPRPPPPPPASPAAVGVDSGGSVARPLDRRRAGNILARTARN